MKELKIGKNEAGQRLDKYLIKLLPDAGASFLYKMLRKKNITLNEKKCTGKEILLENDFVRIFFSDETYTKFQGGAQLHEKKHKSYSRKELAEKEIIIIYEDNDILILNKPIGILSQKSSEQDISMNEYLSGYLLDTGVVTEAELQTFHPAVVNRLDRNTCGLILAGKTLSGLQFLSKIIKDRSLQKYYRTLVYGKWEIHSQLEGFLLKDDKKNQVQIVQQNIPGSDPIKTGIDSIGLYQIEHISITELEIHLITGKSHQIRAHMASCGHPLLGDPKYGSDRYRTFEQKHHLKTQLLCSYRLVFPECEGSFSYLSGKEIVGVLPGYYTRLLEDAAENNH